jgi:hypothetical protein
MELKLNIFIIETEGLIEVFVCACENPSQFYIQVIGPGNALLDDLVKEMTDYYEFEENREIHKLKNVKLKLKLIFKFNNNDFFMYNFYLDSC